MFRTPILTAATFLAVATIASDALASTVTCGPNSFLGRSHIRPDGGTHFVCLCNKGYEPTTRAVIRGANGHVYVPGCKLSGIAARSLTNQPAKQAAPKQKPQRQARGGYVAEPARDNPPQKPSDQTPSAGKPSDGQDDQMTLGQTAVGDSYKLKEVTSDSDFHIISSDGLKLNAKQATQIPLDKKAIAITGKGNAVIILPNGRRFSILPHSRVTLDDFVLNPQSAQTNVAQDRPALAPALQQRVADDSKSKCEGPAGTLGGVQGEYAIELADGRRIQNPSEGFTVVCGMKLVTGSKGRMQVLLRDQTVFTLGPDGELVVDKFVYDADKSLSGKISAELTKGVFRWVTGKVAGEDPADMAVKLPSGDLGIRGTDFEITLAADHSGSVSVASGKVVYRQRSTGIETTLTAGQKATFDADGKASGPN